MKRRSFLAAVAPIMALASPVFSQAPAAAPATGGEPSGRLKPAAPSRPAPTEPAVPTATTSKAGATGAAADAAAPGAEKPKAAKGPTEITAQEAMLDNKSNLAVFSGDVDVKSPEYNVNCDKLTVYMKNQKKAVEVAPEEPKPIGADDAPAEKPAPKVAAKADPKAAPQDQSNSGIDKAIAEGNVKILQIKAAPPGGKPEKYFGTGKKAVFDNNKQTCTLTGWPRVQQSVGGVLTREIVPMEEGVVIVMAPDRIDVTQGRATTRLLDDEAGPNPKPAIQNPQNPKPAPH